MDITGETTAELNETFTVTLTNPTGATLADASGVGTITDDDRTPTSLTLKVTKTRTKIGAKGLLEVAAADSPVAVTLYHRKGAKWVKVSTRTAMVRKLSDRDADGKVDASYRVAFPRPTKGSYRLRASFAGSPALLPTFKVLPFTL